MSTLSSSSSAPSPLIPMVAPEDKGLSDVQPVSAVESFLRLVENATSHPVHLRLLKAARSKDADAALDREFGRIIQELLP